jgi:K+-sensing histidine kinase KdpD
MTARPRVVVALTAGVLAPPLVAFALSPFRGDFADPAAALILTGVVAAVAMFGNRLAGVLAALSAGASFDFFVTKPYDRLSISSVRDVETTIALVLVGIAVTEIAVRGRQHHAVAQREGNLLACIRDVSELVATGASTDLVITTATSSLEEVLGVDGCRFEAVPLRERRLRLARTGEVQLGTNLQDSARGLPSGELEIVALHANRPYGVFVVQLPPAHPLTIEQRVAALALADQVGSALATSQAVA